MKTSSIRSLAIAAAGLMVTATIPALAAGKVCNVRTYGAKADGTTKDTKAIQSAIDDCAKAGGGTVKLTGGTFLSGPIVLKSNITLDIAKGTTLLGSPDHADYPRKTEFRGPGYQAFVGATDAQNITITGGGTIDGNGASWWALGAHAEERRRPRQRKLPSPRRRLRPLQAHPHRRRHRPELALLADRPLLHRRRRHPQRPHPRPAALAQHRRHRSLQLQQHRHRPRLRRRRRRQHRHQERHDQLPRPRRSQQKHHHHRLRLHARPRPLHRQRDRRRRAEHPRRAHPLQRHRPGHPHQGQPRPRQRRQQHLLQGHHHGERQDLDPHQRVLPQGDARRAKSPPSRSSASRRTSTTSPSRT